MLAIKTYLWHRLNCYPPNWTRHAVTYLDSPAVATNGQFQATLLGESGQPFAIQVSSNLLSGSWMGIYTNSAPFPFIDTNASHYPQRFYRAVSVP
jgi:hypothetical protein